MLFLIGIWNPIDGTIEAMKDRVTLEFLKTVAGAQQLAERRRQARRRHEGGTGFRTTSRLRVGYLRSTKMA
jgi:hypothetical protein